MSVSQQLRGWLAPPEQVPTRPRLSRDPYSLDKRVTYPATVNVKALDLESQSSSSQCEKPLPPSPASKASSIDGSSSRRSLRERIKAFKPSKDILYNAILGTSDGMTVPFAVTASLAGVTDARLVMMAGLAELIGGAISMAAGGVLGARTDVQKYNYICEDLARQIDNDPSMTTTLIQETFSQYLRDDQTSSLCRHISSRPPEQQLDFLLRFTPTYHDHSAPSTSGVWKIALVLGLGYFAGLVPLMPYMIVQKQDVAKALYISVGVTAVALAAFGYGKTMLTLEGHSRPWECIRGSIECLFVVGISAGLSVLIIRGIGGTL